jgi:cell division septation protein DedD
MIAARRLGRARHEFRFGGRELVVLGAVFCLIAGLLFAGGVVVGREMGRKGAARLEDARDLGRADAAGARADTPAKSAATRTEEKVTFYRTLTAPTPDLPQVGKPTIEERLVTKEEPAARSAASRAASVATDETAPLPAPEPTAPPVAAAPPVATSPVLPRSPAPRVSEPARPARPVRVAKAPAAQPPAPQLAAAPPAAEPDTWTVQVSAFRSRALAEELRSRLAARGFEAYVFPSITEDGRPRYRVRVGTYQSRADAERAAGDLRSERGLNPLVTPRTTR